MHRSLRLQLPLALFVTSLAFGHGQDLHDGSGADEYAHGMAAVSGKGAPKDLGVAAKAFYVAAKKGHAGGQYMLARLYLKGAGVKKNPKKGAGWLKKAADQGHPKAKALLAKLRSQRRGSPPTGGPKPPKGPPPQRRIEAPGNDEGAAASEGSVQETAMETMRDELEMSPPTPAERAQAPAIRKSLEALTPSLDAARIDQLRDQESQQIAWSTFHLAFLYETGGAGVPQDAAKAKELYRLAARRGYTLAKVFAEELGK